MKQNVIIRLREVFFIIFFVSLVFLITGCSDNSTAPDTNGGNENTPRTAVPEILQGEWQTGTVSSVNFYNPGTGTFGAPSGTGMFYTFHKDGFYEKGVLLQSTLYGHTMTFFAYNKGTMTVNDSVIVLYPTYGKIKSVDNMVQENNYEKPDELKSESLIWIKGFDEYNSETLWLRNPDTGFSAFHKQ